MSDLPISIYIFVILGYLTWMHADLCLYFCIFSGFEWENVTFQFICFHLSAMLYMQIVYARKPDRMPQIMSKCFVCNVSTNFAEEGQKAMRTKRTGKEGGEKTGSRQRNILFDSVSVPHPLSCHHSWWCLCQIEICFVIQWDWTICSDR